MISKAGILETLFDTETLKILDAITACESKSDVLLTRLKLTRKQFYSRMFILVRSGLVKRDKGRYFLTAFGKVIHYSEVSFVGIVEDALKNYWALRAVDLMQMSTNCQEGEWKKIVSLLVQSEEIKNALTRAEVPKIIAQSEVKKIRNLDQNIAKTTVP